MNATEHFVGFFRRRDRYDIVEFIQDLGQGDAGAWIGLGVIASIISFFAIYKKVTGKDFVKSKEERRKARNRRKGVVWEYKRGD